MVDFKLFSLDIDLEYGDVVRCPLKGEGQYDYYVIQSYNLEEKIYNVKYEGSKPLTAVHTTLTKEQLVALKYEYEFTFER